jgi:hypothetical protein
VYLFRATGNPSMATLSTDLPKYAHDRLPRIGPHRQEVDGTGPVVASPVAVAEQAREPTARPDSGRDSRDRWQARTKREIPMRTRDRVRVSCLRFSLWALEDLNL